MERNKRLFLMKEVQLPCAWRKKQPLSLLDLLCPFLGDFPQETHPVDDVQACQEDGPQSRKAQEPQTEVLRLVAAVRGRCHEKYLPEVKEAQQQAQMASEEFENQHHRQEGGVVRPLSLSRYPLGRGQPLVVVETQLVSVTLACGIVAEAQKREEVEVLHHWELQ